MQPAPERLRVRTTDFDEAVAALRSTFGDADLRPDEQGRADLMLHRVRTADLEATRWTLAGVGGGTLDRPDRAEPMILTGIRLDGDLRMWSRWNDMDMNRPFLYPDVIDTALEQPTLANLAISRDVVDQRARALTGVDDFTVRFTDTAPIDAAYDGIWRDTVVWVSRTMDALADRPGTELAQTGLVDVVAGLMLRAFPNTTMEAAHRGDIGGPRTAALRRATAFIDEHIDCPVTVVDIAEAARLSTRGVYAAFRRELGISPMEYLRRARVAAARGELLDGGGTAAIGEIAVRWGFAHVGRFEDLYRETYGESPADTLRR